MDKKKILGLPVAVFVVAIVLTASASAALVLYLSNTITMSTEVKSPLEMTGDTLVAATTYGGENIHYQVTTVNKANAPVWSFAMTEVTAPTGTEFSGSEFTKVMLKDNNYPAGIEVTSLMKYVKADGTLAPFTSIAADNLTTAKLIFDNGVTFDSTKGYIRAVGFNEYNDVTITTNSAIAPGTYVIKSCQLNSLLADC